VIPVCFFHGPDCRGRLQWHHVLPRQRLRRAHREVVATYRRSGGDKPWALSLAITDERNRVWVCVYHHGEVEAKRLYVPVPDSVRDFAEDFGLDRELAALEADRARAGDMRGAA
jgi:hypothetical protein